MLAITLLQKTFRAKKLFSKQRKLLRRLIIHKQRTHTSWLTQAFLHFHFNSKLRQTIITSSEAQSNMDSKISELEYLKSELEEKDEIISQKEMYIKQKKVNSRDLVIKIS